MGRGRRLRLRHQLLGRRAERQDVPIPRVRRRSPGDWGGGHDIGNAALWYSVRAEDGRGEATVLRTLVPRHFGFTRVRQLSEAMYFGRIPERRVVELTPIVFRAAAAGDAVARAIVDRQADEIVRMSGAALRRLHMTKLDAEVVLGGGVFSSGDEDFIGRISERPGRGCARARVRVLAAPPVVGAALLGLDAIGAPTGGVAARPRRARPETRLGATLDGSQEREGMRDGEDRLRECDEGVRRRGRRRRRSVSLEIADGEFMVLVGPSGCGKSTILRMLAGLEEVTAGEIWIDDTLVTDLPSKERDIAMVFQNYALYPHMTVLENIAFGLKLRRVPKAEREQKAREVAHVLAIEHLLERKPVALSGGQRQRVAMGRAMIREPVAFLMDEPLSNLDAKLRVQMRAELARLHDRLGTTTVYVTHDQVEAMTLGDRVAVLRDGLLQQVDTPQRLFARPANLFVAAFVGSPPMNLVEGVGRRTARSASRDSRFHSGRTRTCLPTRGSG